MSQRPATSGARRIVLAGCEVQMRSMSEGARTNRLRKVIRVRIVVNQYVRKIGTQTIAEVIGQAWREWRSGILRTGETCLPALGGGTAGSIVPISGVGPGKPGNSARRLPALQHLIVRFPVFEGRRHFRRQTKYLFGTSRTEK